MTACNCCLAGMFGCGMAGSFHQLLAWRWVTGLGSALQMSGSQLCLADISRADNRARCLGTNQACITQLQTCIQICDNPNVVRLIHHSKEKKRLNLLGSFQYEGKYAAHANTLYISRWYWVILTHTNEMHVQMQHEVVQISAAPFMHVVVSDRASLQQCSDQINPAICTASSTTSAPCIALRRCGILYHREAQHTSA